VRATIELRVATELPSGNQCWYGAAMEPAPVKNSTLKNIGMAILLTPFGIGFIIAACLSGGPSEVYKALRERD
jgi:hypothetical protein